MKIINIMNFVRYIDERYENSTPVLYDTTAAQLELVNEFGFENTFLLQYDAVCDERFQRLFKEKATEKTELGLWYEIVEPLTSACGIPFRSERGWKWDWHIIPGFSMAYTPKEREALADEAMRKFKEVFGYYPKTFASWLIDTHTVNYLSDNYNISAFAICRDQVNTDAYTLIGGYFNQAYYPSRNNIFTPAQTDSMRVNVPVFRLLGPCPIHNYEGKKYLSEDVAKLHGCYTLEPVWLTGSTPEYVDWFFKTFYENEDLGFSYSQIGQENSFGLECDLIAPLRMQFEKAAGLKDVKIQKMGDTGESFKRLFPHKTPATSAVALDNWDTGDIQSAYYDCQKYSANIMRFESRIFLRALFLFDENIEDAYMTETCDTFDAIYENLPIINNLIWAENEKRNCGLMIDTEGAPFNTEKTAEGELKVYWKDRAVVFSEDRITVFSPDLHFYVGEPTANIEVNKNIISYLYKGNQYRLRIENADIILRENGDMDIIAEKGKCVLYPEL